MEEYARLAVKLNHADLLKIIDLHQHLAAAMYQAAGAFNMPERFLNCLVAATGQEGYGEFNLEMVEGLLPVTTDEPGVWDEEPDHD